MNTKLKLIKMTIKLVLAGLALTGAGWLVQGQDLLSKSLLEKPPALSAAARP